MQAGMLYHALLAGSELGHGYDVEQIHVALRERIEVPAFAEAWQIVVGRHSALRAAFRWDQAEGPRQWSEFGVHVPVEREDWSGLTEGERDRRREEFLEGDRARGFDLSRAPLLRLSVFDLAGEQSEFVWTFHHVLLDGRSFPLVLREVFAAYSDLRRGKAPCLPPPPRPYREYIEWLSKLDLAPSREFFAALLAGKLARTPLPCAVPASRSLPPSGYGQLRTSVDAAQLARMASEIGATLGAVAHAAWALVLSRYTGERDVVFGATRNGRHSAMDGAAGSMIGLFINVLPLRVDVDPERTLRDLVGDVRRQSLRLRAHEHTPLVEIQRASAMPPGTPLFESLVTFENGRLEAALQGGADAGVTPSACSLHEQPTPPLNVYFTAGEELEVKLLFDRGRLQGEAMGQLRDAIVVVLDAFARDCHQRVGDVEVLAPGDRKRILFDWNDTRRPFPDELLIHQRFESSVDRNPRAVAVEMEGTALTYAELESRANRLAHALRARGAAPGTFVGVCVDRGPDLVVALMGVAKSGAAYVPLDPDYPRAHREFMLDDSGVLLVVSQLAHRGSIPCGTLLLDGDRELLSIMPDSRPRSLAAPHDPCYAIYTSGSTGRPNGVVLSHRAVVNTLDWMQREFALGPSDRILFVTSPCFDLSVFDCFGMLGAGGTVVVASRRQLVDPSVLLAVLTERRITVWNSAPAALVRLVAFFDDTSRAPTLRLVLLSGDWIPLSLPDAVRRQFVEARVIGLGGATEAAIWSNWFPIEALDPRWSSIPYGRPIQNARYHVLDDRMRPQPVGVPGDLYIGGDCLADGYLHRADLTREHFVTDPFSSRPGDRLYKTGDRARYFPDGNLEFLGRNDSQIKVRGFRVEIGEVEAALLSLDEVRQAVCAAFSDASGQRALVAYVVVANGGSFDQVSVRQRVAARLPDFMVPSRVIRLDELPLSANGKVDRKALPAPGEPTGEGPRGPPRSELEGELVALWETLLKQRPIAVTDHFFGIGGHSLLVLEFIARAKAKLGLVVSLPRFLEQPTIAEAPHWARPAASASDAGPRLRVLNRGGWQTPVVLLSWGALLPLHLEFPSFFGTDRPVYVAESNGVGAAGRSAEELAALYEREIEAACPQGPLIVGALRYGCLPTWHLALRLRRKGRDVPLFVIVDGVEVTERRAQALGRARGGRLVRALGRIRGLGGASHPSGQATSSELVWIRTRTSIEGGEKPGRTWEALVDGRVTVVDVSTLSEAAARARLQELAQTLTKDIDRSPDQR
jgi:amino acid adenylation domain-containing protein